LSRAYSLCTVLIDLPHERDTRLVLLAPLVFLEFPLLLGLKPSQILDKLLFRFLILGLLQVELLKIDHLLATTKTLILFYLSNLLLTGQSLIEHNLIALLLNSQLLFTKKLLSLVVTNQLQIAFNGKYVLLSFHFSLDLIFSLPLLFKHLALDLSEFTVLNLGLHACVLLPVKHGLCIIDPLLLLLYFLAFSLLLCS
jgi:hypothetical protein